MTENSNSEDMPKIVATIMVTVPSLVFKSGWAYLRMRKRAHKVSKQLQKQLVANGIPSHYAGKLAAQYDSDLSIRKFIRGMDIPFGATRR